MKRLSLALVLGLLLAAPAAAHIPVGGATPRGLAPAGPLSPSPWAMLPAQQSAEPAIVPPPRAQCRPGARPEPSIQGRLPKEVVDSGAAAKGYWCNIEMIGHSGSTGGFRVHRYIDKAGHECAFYDTALLFPTNALSLSGELTGVAVLDMSDPKHPVRTATLVTPAMQSPHESLNISVERGVLAAVMGNPAAYPGGVDVYDISQDCRHPVVKSAAFPASPFGHESGMAPDGLTFYPTSIGTGDTTAVDITNPTLPRQLWHGGYNTHGMTVSDDGNRGYFATGDGLVITDLSQVQARKPNPQVREISRLVWSNITVPQIAIPVTIKGLPYLVEIDEYSEAAEGGGVTANGPRVGAARIIDISDETKPRVVSNIRLAVHQPENRAAIAGDYGAQSPVQGYAGHYCNVPRRHEPGIVACSMIASGLRVFDIRDPEHPKEIAYFMSPPSTISATGGPIIDERSNWAMSQPAFAPERGEIWYSDGNSGFYALRMDPAVWPFADETGAAGCTVKRAFLAVTARNARGGLELRFRRREKLPVTVELFRMSAGRRVLASRRIARFAKRARAVTLRKRLSPGIYVARFRMLDGRRVVDTERFVFEKTRAGWIDMLEPYQRDHACDLLRAFKLGGPAFGGTGGQPLRASYRLTAPADVTVTITRGPRLIKRFVNRGAVTGRTYRITLPAKGHARGEYRVKLRVAAGDDLAFAELVSRRL